jgi:hypothetical protein
MKISFISFEKSKGTYTCIIFISLSASDKVQKYRLCNIILQFSLIRLRVLDVCYGYLRGRLTNSKQP